MNTKNATTHETREELEARIARDKAALELLNARESYLDRNHAEVEAGTLKVLSAQLDSDFKERVEQTRALVRDALWQRHFNKLGRKAAAQERVAEEAVTEHESDAQQSV